MALNQAVGRAMPAILPAFHRNVLYFKPSKIRICLIKLTDSTCHARLDRVSSLKNFMSFMIFMVKLNLVFRHS